MIRRPMTFTAMVLVLSMFAAPAAAHDSDTPLHAHVLIHRPAIEWLTTADDGVPWDGLYLTSIRRCIDMPVTPLQGHHDNVHRGNGGAGLANAGHAFAPAEPLDEFADCAEFEALLSEFGPLPLGSPPPSIDD